MINGSRKTPLTATYVKRRAMLGASVVFALLAVWGVHHVFAVNQVVRTGVPKLAVLYAILFVMLVWQTFYGYFEKPHQVTPEQWGDLQKLDVAVIVPLYNEDPQIVRESILSMLHQSRPIQAISVCDDGSNLVDYYEVEQWFYGACEEAGVTGYWRRQQNAGKREAQIAAQEMVTWCDIYALVDSDSLMDAAATQEALKPFADPEVMSVASMVAAANTKQNLFTRVMDLWYVALQFTDRSIMSRFNSVLVNYGALAYYRREVITENVDAYLNETFMGKPMRISDDSLLTLFSLLKGKTVQQITSWAFTYMPTTFKHHKNQQIRWMRGSFIRSIWRFRYLPVARFAFWGHLLKWMQYVIATAAILGVLLTQDLTDPATIGLILLIQSCIYYGVMLRYLSVRRSDESFLYQLGTWAMTPIAAVWASTFLRTWRIWAMATCINMAWGTRNKVEVSAVLVQRRKPMTPRLVAVGAFLALAFVGSGWFFMSQTTPDENSVVVHAQDAGVVPEDLSDLFAQPAPDTVTPEPAPAETAAEDTPEAPYTRPTVRRTPTPTQVTVRPSTAPTTVPVTPRPTTTRPALPTVIPTLPTDDPTTETPTPDPTETVDPDPTPEPTETTPPVVVIPEILPEGGENVGGPDSAVETATSTPASD
jgi:hyaluronan synthase